MQTGTWIGGDVVIEPTAAIAYGVLIQAEPDCAVRIGAGVCVGMGSVIHAYGGNITIGAGANLGAGVLLYGSLEIGNHACIGAASSLINYSVSMGGVIPPGSLCCPPAVKPTAASNPDENSQSQPAEDRLRIHARMHLQQFLSKIFI